MKLLDFDGLSLLWAVAVPVNCNIQCYRCGDAAAETDSVWTLCMTSKPTRRRERGFEHMSSGLNWDVRRRSSCPGAFKRPLHHEVEDALPVHLHRVHTNLLNLSSTTALHTPTCCFWYTTLARRQCTFLHDP